MKKMFFIFAFAAVFLALNAVVPAQKLRDTPVKSTVEDADSLFAPYSIRSDGLGTYLNGTASVVSRIQGIGDWELDMLASPSRRVWVDFSSPVEGNAIATPLPSGSYPVRFLAQCPADLRNLGAGLSQNCKLIVAVNYGTDRYSVRFGYVAGTGLPLWTCAAAANGKCTNWQMTSNTNATGKLVAELLKVTTVRGKNVTESFGKYYFSFNVNVANQ